MQIPPRRLLIACGNDMHGDQGAPWELARQAVLKGWPMLCVTQLELKLVEKLNGLDQVVFVDADPEPGPDGLRRICLQSQHECPAHCVLPARLLQQCRRRYGQAPRGWALTLDGVDFGYHLGLSDISQASIKTALQQLDDHFAGDQTT